MMEATEKRAIEEPTEEHPETESEETPAETDSDVACIMNKMGYTTHQFANGLLAGTDYIGIKGTNSVLVDTLIVLDLRSSKFGRSPLAMKSEVLEVATQPLERLLNTVNSGERLQLRKVPTVCGTLEIPMLLSESGDNGSEVFESRSAYVIVDGVRPSSDFDWFADESRIIGLDEFSLCVNSSRRTRVTELSKSIDSKKWDHMKKSVRGWYLVAALIFAAANILALLSVASLFSLLLLVGDILFMMFFFAVTRKAVNDFRSTCQVERQATKNIGDMTRFKRGLEENKQDLEMMAELNFVISPMVSLAARSLAKDDLDSAVEIIDQIFTECILRSSSVDNDYSGDKGLAKFIGLFEGLGVPGIKKQKEGIALSYVALTGHVTNPLSEEEFIKHITLLNDVLFQAGLLRAEAKSTVDDTINYHCLGKAVQTLDEEIVDTDPELTGRTAEENLVSDIEESGEAAAKQDAISVEETTVKEPPCSVDDRSDEEGPEYASSETPQDAVDSVAPEPIVTGPEVVSRRRNSLAEADGPTTSAALKTEDE